jgi:ribosome-associated protein
MKKIEITHEPVELYKILKFEAVVASGGEAKALIAAGEVLVNGEIEMRKRCKMKSGDVITVFDEEFELCLEGAV